MRLRRGELGVLNVTLIGVVCVSLLGLGMRPQRVSAQQPTIERLTVSDGNGNQRVPRVSGKWVVFEDDRRQVAGTTTVDVRFWNSETKDERRASQTPSARLPEVSGSLAVWAESTAAGFDLIVYDLEDREIVRRFERAGGQNWPSISARKVVWQENVNGVWDVLGYDLEERDLFTVSNASGDQTRPAIDGDLVAFEDSREATVWYRDLKNDRLRKIDRTNAYEPAVFGDKIALRAGGNRDSAENANIHVFDVSTNTLGPGLATTLEGSRGNPRIDGNLVVWWDSRDGDRDIYGYDLATKTEFRIAADGGDQDSPDVSGSLVVWSDRRGSDADIRAARLSTASATPTASPTSATAPPIAATATPLPTGGAAVRDNRYFTQSGFRIDNDRFWEYFRLRGGVKNFGYPSSRTFRFMGYTSQFFQRHIMQLGPDGPRLMNLLDPGLMPYTQINTSTFPAFDESLVAQAPTVGSAGYDTQIVEFIRRNAPDTFSNSPTAFFSTFVNQVDLATAFPTGNANPSLLGLLNLELAGSVTSKPMADPRNGGFIYQRFQRVILHYDAACGCTQPILLGDWFKSVITGQNLPSDLAGQAQGSSFYLQYNNSAANGLNRPVALPDTDMRFAFDQQ